jgi:hypothetical protein
MTLTMADSIYAANLPPGYGAYAGYVNGNWPDFGQIAVRNPSAYLLPIAVTSSADATCLDIETGDAAAADAPAWVRRQFARGIGRPVLYSSVSNMPAVLSVLSGAGISRASVRLWSAHYGAGQHICGPYSCKWPGVPPMDGTQWTDSAPGMNGSKIDASVLTDGFFGGATPPPPQPPGSSGAAPWEENMMRQLPVVQQGATGTDVRSVQSLCGARGHPTAVDGAFGPNTASAVKSVQAANHLVVDGIVGPATWPALMAV